MFLQLGKGDLANRIITVGAVGRLEKIEQFLDVGSIRFKHTSPRGFTTVTGTYNQIPISIVAIGMGISMMDFFVRETRNIVDGPLYIIRFGTCGGLSKEAVAGSVVVASQGSAYICRNHDGFADLYTLDNKNDAPYVDFSQAYTLSKVSLFLISICVCM